MARKKRYKDLHWLDKAIDAALVVGVLVGIMLFVSEFTLEYNEIGKAWLRVFDVALLGIFFVDTTRHFLKSRSFGHYLQHHWPDLAILGIAIISLSAVLFVGFGRLSWLIREERMFLGLGRFIPLGLLCRIF